MQIHSLYMRLHLSRLTSLVVIGVFVFMEVSQHIPTTRQTRDVFCFFRRPSSFPVRLDRLQGTERTDPLRTAGENGFAQILVVRSLRLLRLVRVSWPSRCAWSGWRVGCETSHSCGTAVRHNQSSVEHVGFLRHGNRMVQEKAPRW